MFRGLDTWGRSPDDDEPTIIKVADRPLPESEVTVYVDGSTDGEAGRRRDAILEEFDQLEAAGVLESPSVVSWGEADAPARYREFVDAVGERALTPFFAEHAVGTAVEVPTVCIALRNDGELTGLYPRRKGHADQHVEHCLRALASGDRIENADDR